MKQKYAFMEFALNIGLCISREFYDLSESDFKNRINQFIKKQGFVRQVLPEQMLKRLNFEANEIIDIGVRHGTPWLYKSFPNSEFFLVDPQKAGESILHEKPKKYSFLNCGIGSEPGKAVLKEQLAKSTLLNRTKLTETETIEEYEVDLFTLDQIINNHCKTDRIGIKIDSEGFELECIKGLKENWDKVEFLIAEVSVKNRFKDSYDFSQFLAELRTHDFLFANILNSPGLGVPAFFDVLFLPKDHAAFNLNTLSPR